MKMQKGAGGLAQYWSGGASAFILFFVRRRVARSFFQDGRVARVGNPGPSKGPTTTFYLADWGRNATSTLRCVAR